MDTENMRRGWTPLIVIVLLGATGCTEPDVDLTVPPPGWTAVGPLTGTGTLTVAVSDLEGQPLINASVGALVGSEPVGDALTSSTGVVTIDALPPGVNVVVSHELAEWYSEEVSVAQRGGTFLAVTMQPARPYPTPALLPVSIPITSVSTDRSELTLQVTVVSSSFGHFLPAEYGDWWSYLTTPSMGLAVRNSDTCVVWLDRLRTSPHCDSLQGDGAYTVSVEQFRYDNALAAPVLTEPGPARDVMLLMDQSARVATLDPDARRSFAARQFITRIFGSAERQSMSLAGFAGNGANPAAPAMLPERPLWVPLGAGTVFSSDAALLRSAVGILEPLVGGSAPVFDSLQAAVALTTVDTPPGHRAIVALLGGDDDSDLSESARRAALASIRQQRDQSGIQFVLIAAASQSSERRAIAELAAALRAPMVSLGVNETWKSGSYAALELAADLIDGVPLPTLSGTFRVKATEPNTFPAGTMLAGTVFLDSEPCPWDCAEVALEFAVEIP